MIYNKMEKLIQKGEELIKVGEVLIGKYGIKFINPYLRLDLPDTIKASPIRLQITKAIIIKGVLEQINNITSEAQNMFKADEKIEDIKKTLIDSEDLSNTIGKWMGYFDAELKKIPQFRFSKIESIQLYAIYGYYEFVRLCTDLSARDIESMKDITLGVDTKMYKQESHFFTIPIPFGMYSVKALTSMPYPDTAIGVSKDLVVLTDTIDPSREETKFSPEMIKDCPAGARILTYNLTLAEMILKKMPHCAKYAFTRQTEISQALITGTDMMDLPAEDSIDTLLKKLAAKLWSILYVFIIKESHSEQDKREKFIIYCSVIYNIVFKIISKLRTQLQIEDISLPATSTEQRDMIVGILNSKFRAIITAEDFDKINKDTELTLCSTV